MEQLISYLLSKGILDYFTITKVNALCDRKITKKALSTVGATCKRIILMLKQFQIEYDEKYLFEWIE